MTSKSTNLLLLDYREGPKIILYGIGISCTLAQANQEQAKQALTVVISIQLAPS